MNFTDRKKKIILLFLVLGLFLLPLFFPNPARIGMFVGCGVASILAMGWLMILRIGCLSLGQAAFLAIGGYTSALLAQKAGISPWIGLLAGGTASGVVALVIGVVVLRVRGLSLSIITFAFAEMVRLLFSTLDFFGGHGGITGIPSFTPLPLPALGTVRFDSPLASYYVLLLIVLVCGTVMWRMDQSALGRIFRALPQNEALAQSLGVHPLRYKVISFVTACFFAGVAGAFTAHYYNVLFPGSYTPIQSIFVQIQATVGGVASVALGGFLGGSLMVMVESWLLNVDSRWVYIFYGAVILVVTFFLPEGLLSLPQKIKQFTKKK
ncbi:MAG: branched-chain amino acid ABC transporter permease [Thermodesulfobacteriota bacterium]